MGPVRQNVPVTDHTNELAAAHLALDQFGIEGKGGTLPIVARLGILNLKRMEAEQLAAAIATGESVDPEELLAVGDDLIEEFDPVLIENERLLNLVDQLVEALTTLRSAAERHLVSPDHAQLRKALDASHVSLAAGNSAATPTGVVRSSNLRSAGWIRSGAHTDPEKLHDTSATPDDYQVYVIADDDEGTGDEIPVDRLVHVGWLWDEEPGRLHPWGQREGDAKAYRLIG